ncbi:MAG: enoyl-CoA hydratase [Acidimicrobiia bacterium]|nr:enoyl-CoA hydratase [Acidimicrobiia bacterium]
MSEYEYEQITIERREAVTVLTLNRPEKLNAWTRQMGSELVDAIMEANNDSFVGAVVVTGAGRAFCAGADIGGQFKSQMDKAASKPPKADQQRKADESNAEKWVEICRRSKPLVAAINGHAIGVGLTMVLPFDHLIAAQGAKLSCRFVKMGITPELASSHYLVQRCGWGAASDLALSGRMVEAEEAKELGLVDRVVPGPQVLGRAIAKANEFAENPAPQLRMIKGLLTENACETDLDVVQEREMTALRLAYETPEHHEAVTAFLEKRPPKFR